MRTVLFLCTGNSARSIMAEALLNHWAPGKFQAFSAGSVPKGTVHPLAVEVLEGRGLPTTGLRSKSWDEFAGPTAASIDFVITVCDNAANETCPVWPGQPLTAHWSLEDPAAVEGSDEAKRRAFAGTFQELDARIKIFVSLPFDKLDRLTLQERLSARGF